MTRREVLIRASLRAAVDLTQISDTLLTDRFVAAHIERIAEDLLYAVNDKEA